LTGHGLDVAWSGHHAIVTMPEEIDLVNSAGVREQLVAVVRGYSWSLRSTGSTGTGGSGAGAS